MYFSARRYQLRKRRTVLLLRRIIKLVINCGALAIIFFGTVNWLGYEMVVQSPVEFNKIEQEIVSPLPKEAGESGKLQIQIATPSATPKSTPRGAVLEIVPAVEAKELRTIEGIASYYSRSGCVGCSESLTMANGESLDDSALTVALTPELVGKYKLLNDYVTVENAQTGKSVRARVTDTGGFGKLDRIADLSVATRDYIKCSNLCKVKITY